MRGGAFVLALSILCACQYDPPAAVGGDDPNTPVDGSPGGEVDAPIGVADVDQDTVPDATDNCPQIANTNQADEDADLVGNACDNCPHVANLDQADQMETLNAATADGVGDACDPRPTQGGNAIRLFMPFDDPTEIADWSFAGNTSRTVAGGSLVITATDLVFVWKNDLDAANSFVTTSATFDAIDNTQQWRGATINTRWRRTTDFGHGAGCGEMRDTQVNGGTPFRDLVAYNGAAFQHGVVAGGTANVSAGHTATYTVRGIPNNNQLSCTIGSNNTFTTSIGNESGTGINFAVWGATVSFRYLVVID